jgi:hypothetical protein
MVQLIQRPRAAAVAWIVLGVVLGASGPGLLATATSEQSSPVPTKSTSSTDPSCPPALSSPGASSPGVSGEVALEPMADLTGDRVYTLGDVAIVEQVVSLELREAWRGWTGAPLPPPDGQAAYTFLVRFSWDGTQPEFLDISGGYYNSIAFSLRDDESFEYPVLQGDSIARQPQLMYGEVAEGQSVQGWLTFHGPADAEWVELTYAPIADEQVFFRVAAPQA